MNDHYFRQRNHYLWATSSFLLVAWSAVTPLHAAAFYSADASYCDTSHCTRDRTTNQPIPQVAGVGYYAGSGAYAAEGGLATANVSFDPGAPTLLADGQYGVVADATVAYTFQIKGAPNTYVPLHVRADITAGAVHATDDQGNNYQLADNPDYPGPNDGVAEPGNYEISSNATLRVFQDSTDIGLNTISVRSLLGEDSDRAANATGQSMLVDQTYYFLSDTDISVGLTASAELGYSTTYGVSGNQYGNVAATADPIFTISDDPAFSGFSLVGIPEGAGPAITAAVPETATWTMMIFGFGVLLGVQRHRLRKAIRPRCSKTAAQSTHRQTNWSSQAWHGH